MPAPFLRRPAPDAGAGRIVLTADGVRISARHDPPDSGAQRPDLALVVAHGFTGSWSRVPMRRVVAVLRATAGVVTFDFRGHGRSGGVSTVGDLEVLDVDAAVRLAHVLGYAHVVTIGFSMGGATAVRHAALHGTPAQSIAAVVTLSAPSRWRYQGSPAMRRVHVAIESSAGRVVTRHLFGTRIARAGWDPEPEAPRDLAARVAPTPLLVVHGDADQYFPRQHADDLYAAAREPKELMVVPGFGHAEIGATPVLLDQVVTWVLAQLPTQLPAQLPAQERR